MAGGMNVLGARKREAESNDAMNRPSETMKKAKTDSKLVSTLGLESVSEWKTLGESFWPSFVPFRDARMERVAALMKNKSAPIILKPLFRISRKILARSLSRGVGAILVGHKMSGKSLTLEFLYQFLNHVAKEKKFNFYGFKISLKTQATGDGPPQTFNQMFRQVNQYICKAGLIEACKSLLKAAVSWSHTGAVMETSLLLAHCKIFAIGDVLTKATKEELAFLVLTYYERIDPFKVNSDDLRDLLITIAELFSCDGTQQFLNGPCFIILDELDELLTAGSSMDRGAREVAEYCILPLVKRVSTQAHSPSSNLFVILSGSTTGMASYVKINHLEAHVCLQERFAVEECEMMWKYWRENLLETIGTVVSDAEFWIIDSSLGTDAGDNSSLGKAMLATTDGVPGCLVELFQMALRSKAREESALALTR
jgi:hypothetical protein